MKTKTGKLLMMQMKAKSNQSVPIERQTSPSINRQQFTPVKPQIVSLDTIKPRVNENPNEEEQVNLKSKEVFSEIAHLKQENADLRKEVQRIKNQLYEANLRPQTTFQSTQTNEFYTQALLKQPNQFTETKDKNIVNSQQKPKPDSKLKQKCSALEVQNYRLIQNNYFLLLNMKKNLRSYKDSLTQILSKLESLQFAQAVQDVYQILNQLKSQELTSSEFQSSLFPNKKEETPVSTQKTPISAIKPLKFIKLTLDSAVFSLSHYEEGNAQERQNDIQIRLKKLPYLPVTNQNPYTSRQSSSFHLINSRQPDPEFSHFSNNKLFNSQIRDHDHHISALDKVSLQQKMESDWDHSARKQPTIFKCNGNTTDLYRMLMLQALAIQGFIA